MLIEAAPIIATVATMATAVLTLVINARVSNLQTHLETQLKRQEATLKALDNPTPVNLSKAYASGFEQQAFHMATDRSADRESLELATGWLKDVENEEDLDRLEVVPSAERVLGEIEKSLKEREPRANKFVASFRTLFIFAAEKVLDAAKLKASPMVATLLEGISKIKPVMALPEFQPLASLNGKVLEMIRSSESPVFGEADLRFLLKQSRQLVDDVNSDSDVMTPTFTEALNRAHATIERLEKSLEAPGFKPTAGSLNEISGELIESFQGDAPLITRSLKEWKELSSSFADFKKDAEILLASAESKKPIELTRLQELQQTLAEAVAERESKLYLLNKARADFVLEALSRIQRIRSKKR